jgi:hypothetical protein
MVVPMNMGVDSRAFSTEKDTDMNMLGEANVGGGG